jgi:hypothetical protein
MELTPNNDSQPNVSEQVLDAMDARSTTSPSPHIDSRQPCNNNDGAYNNDLGDPLNEQDIRDVIRNATKAHIDELTVRLHPRLVGCYFTEQVPMAAIESLLLALTESKRHVRAYIDVLAQLTVSDAAHHAHIFPYTLAVAVYSSRAFPGYVDAEVVGASIDGLCLIIDDDDETTVEDIARQILKLLEKKTN